MTTPTPAQVLREVRCANVRCASCDKPAVATTENGVLSFPYCPCGSKSFNALVDKLAALAEQAPLAPVAVEAVQQPDLLPCPFCGGEPIVSREWPGTDIACSKCWASATSAKSWNARAALSAPAAPTVAPAEPVSVRDLVSMLRNPESAADLKVSAKFVADALESSSQAPTRYCETCERNVSDPCSSADCSTPEHSWGDAKYPLVHRLRFTFPSAHTVPSLLQEAADEIERLFTQSSRVQRVELTPAQRDSLTCKSADVHIPGVVDSSETPNGSPALNTLKRIVSPAGKPDLHQWTGVEWVPVGWSVEAMASAAKALEFAEYMAKGAEQFIEAVNRYGTAMTEITEEEEVEQAQEGITEYGRGLRSDIYEFRKRAALANKPAPTGEVE